jgi:hypothetical protein
MAEDSREQGKSGGERYQNTNNDDTPQAGTEEAQNQTAQVEPGGIVIPFTPNRNRTREGQAQNRMHSQPQAQNGMQLPPQIELPSQLPQAQEPQYDFEELLRQVQGKRSRIGKPPREATENLGEWLRWGGGIMGKPFGVLLDLMDDAGGSGAANGIEAQGEYMSPLKKGMYLFGGGVIFAWSAFITQAVMPHIFPFLEIAGKSGDDFFKNGLTIALKAIVASLIFGFMLSVIETMLYDPNKSKPKKLLIMAAFVVDIAINTIGWAELFGHSRRLEWNPLAPLFRGENIEWGSFFCEFSAILNAALPEIMWEKARRARKRAKEKQGAESSRGEGQGQERGVMLRNAQGELQWVSEEQLRAMAALQNKPHHKKKHGGQGGGRGGGR